LIAEMTPPLLRWMLDGRPRNQHGEG